MRRFPGINNWGVVLLVWLFALAIWVPTYIPAERWWELREVRVSDTVLGGNPTLSADRTIYHTFRGSYSVVIRRFPDNFTVCTAAPSAPFTYRGPRDDAIEADLAWWLLNEEALAECDLQPGQYRVFTQHTIHDPFWWAPWVDEIHAPENVSNVFTIFPTEEPPVELLEEQRQRIDTLERQLRELGDDNQPSDR